MADLDFSHRVSEIPAAAPLPNPIQRRVGVEASAIPDFQGAASSYAASSNWMSNLGSDIAAKASTAIATKIGSEMGKNPQGDLGIPLTEFDKTMQASYNTQAQATLGLQAYKLINDSNLEAAKAPRLTPDLIQKTNQNIVIGLQNIFKNAPADVRGHLEYQFGQQQINQFSSLTQRMIGEQREDQRNTTNNSSGVNAEHAYSFAVQGNIKAARAAVESTIRLNEAALASNTITPEVARQNIEAAKLSAGKGQEVYEYEKRRAQGQGEQYLKERAEFGDKSDPHYLEKTNYLLNYVNHQESLRAQDQQLRMAQFAVRLAENPDAISGSDLANLQSQLTPIQGQKVKLELINALNRRRSENQESNALMADWGNSELHARAGEKAQRVGFDALVQKRVDTSAQTTGTQVSRERAQVEVAAAAGAPVKVFTQSLQYKLSSGNPQLLESAAQQIHDLYQMGAGHALAGLTEKDKAAYGAYEALRGSLQPTDAARETINNVYNQDPTMYKANQQKWADFINLQTRGKGISHSKLALTKFGFSENQFLNPSLAQAYGMDMFEKYATNFQLLGGDEVTAQRVTQRYIDENYGATGVNGGSNQTLHPLEKVLGYDNSSVVPAIQKDVINQLNEHFAPVKSQFDKHETNEYWETQPLTGKKHGIFSTTYDPITVKRFTRDSSGKIKSESFNVVIQGNSFDNWDVAVMSESGLRPLYQVAPYLGVISYQPNKKWIDEEYLGASHIFPTEQLNQKLKPYLTPGEKSNG